MGRLRAWSLLTVDHAELQYGGNAGYHDDPSREYRYDSEVGNHKQVAEGDVVVLRTKSSVLGIAQIRSITADDKSKKFRQRCPDCNATTLKARHRKVPRWRCHKCRNEFDQPLEEQLLVTAYTAVYAGTFLVNTIVTLSEIRGLVLRPSGQMSISELDLAKLEMLFAKSSADAADFFRALSLRITLNPADGLVNESDLSMAEFQSYLESALDSRTKVLRSILERRGQSGFRRSLTERYGARCVITGCQLLSVLEAAHIDPYRGHAQNHPENGILLRADLHTLFDLGLLAINPKDWTVHVHPDVMQSDAYRSLNGQSVSWVKNKPSIEALTRRWKSFLLQKSDDGGLVDRADLQ